LRPAAARQEETEIPSLVVLSGRGISVKISKLRTQSYSVQMAENAKDFPVTSFSKLRKIEGSLTPFICVMVHELLNLRFFAEKYLK
jgi:hypothetical protein